MVRLYYEPVTRESGKHPDYMTEDEVWASLLGSEVDAVTGTDQIKCRYSAMRFITEGLGLGSYPGSGSMDIDLSDATYMLGYAKSDTTDNVEFRLISSADNYKTKEVTIATSGEWVLFEELLSDFSDSGNPAMSGITEIQLRDTVSGYRVVLLDEFVFAQRYVFDAIQRISPYQPIVTTEKQVPSKSGSTLEQLKKAALTIQIDATVLDDSLSEAQLLSEVDTLDTIHLSGNAVIIHDSTRELTTMKVCLVDDYRPPSRLAGERRHYKFSARYKESKNRD